MIPEERYCESVGCDALGDRHVQGEHRYWWLCHRCADEWESFPAASRPASAWATFTLGAIAACAALLSLVTGAELDTAATWGRWALLAGGLALAAHGWRRITEATP